MTKEYPLSTNPSIFVGKKPVAVVIDGETIPVNTWVKVYKEILLYCIQDPNYYERLMSLRGRLSGQQRFFIAANPDTMSSPLKICEGIYAEVHYGSQTLMHILTVRVLTPMGFDYSNIKVVIK